jgi:multimeric flavodoxin WrbA
MFERQGSMYVVGVSGSPRAEGNTAILVKAVLKAIEGEKKFISLADLNINPCKSCDRCWKEKIECVIDDDVRWILKELEKCDAMILGSPCYFKSVSAQLKMLMDRTVSIYSTKSLRNKIGAAVVTHDVKGWGGALVLHSIIDFYSTHRIIYAGGIIGEGGEEIGHVKKDKQAMKKAKELAKRITELVEITK